MEVLYFIIYALTLNNKYQGWRHEFLKFYTPTLVVLLLCYFLSFVEDKHVRMMNLISFLG